MISNQTKYPFFGLIQTTQQAELALSVLSHFGSEKEKELMRPEIEQIQQDFMHAEKQTSLVLAINNLLHAYLDLYGDFSDHITIFLSKTLIEQKLTLAK